MRGSLFFTAPGICGLCAIGWVAACSSDDTVKAVAPDAGAVAPDAGAPPEKGPAPDAGSSLPDDGPIEPRPLSDVIADYAKSWGATDATEREQLLTSSFVADGVYTDSIPTNTAQGRAAFLIVIEQFQKSSPGTTIVPTTVVDQAGGHFRFGWKVVAAAGTTLLNGEDEGETADDGRVKRISGFFDTPSTAESPPAFAALLTSLNDATIDARATDLATALVENVSWTDRWMHGDTRDEVLSHFNEWLTPPIGSKFTLVGNVDQHDQLFRAKVTVESSAQKDVGEFFGHIGADGLMDWGSFFDGKLTALP